MSDFLDVMRKRLSYMVSLPERTVRSLAAVAGGTTTLLTETLFPESLRGTTLYKIFVGDMQRFIVEKVAEVQKEGADEEDCSDPSYVPKKMIGGALETAGLFAMHFSPLWVFAIAGDVAAGSNVFLQRLVEQLKQNGVVDETVEVTGLEDLLGAMQETSRKSAGAIDTPPLSREELKTMAAEMTESYGKMFSKATDLVPRLDTLWERMKTVASRENVSMERIGGILSVDVASWGKKGIGTAMAVGKTGTDLFGEQVLTGYARTLDAITEQGLSDYLSQQMAPFLDAAARHFSVDKKTWTESVAEKIIGRETTDDASADDASDATGEAEASPNHAPPDDEP